MRVWRLREAQNCTFTYMGTFLNLYMNWWEIFSELRDGSKDWDNSIQSIFSNKDVGDSVDFGAIRFPEEYILHLEWNQFLNSFRSIIKIDYCIFQWRQVISRNEMLKIYSLVEGSRSWSIESSSIFDEWLCVMVL